MWKPDTNKQTLPHGVSVLPMVGHQKNHILKNIRMLLGRDCKVENVMRLLKDIGVFKEI